MFPYMPYVVQKFLAFSLANYNFLNQLNQLN
jgi:hypothetical protein